MFTIFLLCFSLHCLYCSQIPKSQEDLLDQNLPEDVFNELSSLRYGSFLSSGEVKSLDNRVPKPDSEKSSIQPGVYDENTKQRQVTEIINDIEKISKNLKGAYDIGSVGSFGQRLLKENSPQVVQDLLSRPLKFVVFFTNLSGPSNVSSAYPPYFPKEETIGDMDQEEEEFVNRINLNISGKLVRNSIATLTLLKKNARKLEECEKIEFLVKKLELVWIKVISKRI
jgi:hypothetical protein